MQRTCMRAVCLVAALVGYIHAEALEYDIILDGHQEVPPVNTTGHGQAHLTLDTNSGAFVVSGTYADLMSSAIAANLRGPAGPGQNGFIIFSFTVSHGTTGTISGSIFVGGEVEDWIRNGMTYLEIPTVGVATGEIRGQIVPRVPGDLNCDGQVNFADIDPFVLALSNPAGYEAAFPNCNLLNADVNNDGAVNFADIDPFVALLGG